MVEAVRVAEKSLGEIHFGLTDSEGAAASFADRSLLSKM
jgi:hypothetical protein